MNDADDKQSRGHPNCTILQISMDNKRLIKTPEGNPEFGRILQDFNPEESPSQTLFVLEDLSTGWIEYFGSLLDIDPHFFANHLRSSEYEHNNNKTNAPALPSARRRRNFTVLSYFKPILLESECGLNKTEMRDFNVLRRMTLRHVKRQNSNVDEFTIGLVTRMVCYWNRVYTNNNSWVGKLTLSIRESGVLLIVTFRGAANRSSNTNPIPLLQRTLTGHERITIFELEMLWWRIR